MWDDGEFYNGVDATGPVDRLANAKQAWFESFPLIDPGDRRAYRRFSWGDLADVSMIDVRAYRDPAVEGIVHTGPGGANEPGRTTLGAEQYDWFTRGLAASNAAWRVVGNPYNINPWRLVNLEFLRAFRPDLPPNSGIYAPNEAWDDYMTERRELLQFLVDAGVTDTVFASGHTHVQLVAELRADFDRPRTPVAAFDVCTGSLTADPDPRTRVPGRPADRCRRGGPAGGRAVRARPEPSVPASHEPGRPGLHRRRGHTDRDARDDPQHRHLGPRCAGGRRCQVPHRQGRPRIEILPTPRRRGSFA